MYDLNEPRILRLTDGDIRFMIIGTKNDGTYVPFAHKGEISIFFNSSISFNIYLGNTGQQNKNNIPCKAGYILVMGNCGPHLNVK